MSSRRDHLIVNDLGLHARAASKLVALANTFEAEVFIGSGGREVNGKSILGVLMLAAAKGTTISVRCEGQQEDEACAALGKLVDDGFGEL
ncbi:MAG: HPr family phosphocarrier protein [Nannocystaceae bacterium]|nr:HPr family phosphocarrier protein [bacterium]